MFYLYYLYCVYTVVSILLCLYCCVYTVVSILLCLYCRVYTVVSILLCIYCCVCTVVSILLCLYCCVYTVVSILLCLYCRVYTVVSILLCILCCIVYFYLTGMFHMRAFVEQKKTFTDLSKGFSASLIRYLSNLFLYKVRTQSMLAYIGGGFSARPPLLLKLETFYYYIFLYIMDYITGYF